MPELKEVFEMVTKQTEPDLDAWQEQEQRQRRAARNRKVSALAPVAAVLFAHRSHRRAQLAAGP